MSEIHYGKLTQALHTAISDLRLSLYETAYDGIRAQQIHTIIEIAKSVRDPDDTFQSTLQKAVDIYFKLDDTLKFSEVEE
jgi:hypothetical protein